MTSTAESLATGGVSIEPRRVHPGLAGDGYSIRRYYDPQTGQFINVDPAVDQTDAPYSYVAGNPVNATDPLGLCGFLDFSCYATSTANFVESHPVIVGTALGVASIATGGGALIAIGAFDASALAVPLTAVSLAIGAGATSLDASQCVARHGAACAAFALGATGLALSAPAALEAFGLIESSTQTNTALAIGGVYVGGAAVLIDAIDQLLTSCRLSI